MDTNSTLRLTTYPHCTLGYPISYIRTKSLIYDPPATTIQPTSSWTKEAIFGLIALFLSIPAVITILLRCRRGHMLPQVGSWRSISWRSMTRREIDGTILSYRGTIFVIFFTNQYRWRTVTRLYSRNKFMGGNGWNQTIFNNGRTHPRYGRGENANLLCWRGESPRIGLSC